MSTQNDTTCSLNAGKNNGYFSINSEKLPNIRDANFNKSYLTAKSPERGRSCSPALLNLNNGSTTTSSKLKNSENTIISEKHVHSNMNLKSNAMPSSPQVIANQLALLKIRQHKVYLGILVLTSTKEKLALRKPITMRNK